MRPALCYFNVLEPVGARFCYVLNQPPAPPNVGGLSGGGGAKVSGFDFSDCSSFLPGVLSAAADDFFSTAFVLSGCPARAGC